MSNEQAKSELMQIYGMLSEEKKQALDVLMAQNCDQCEVGNPCLYCEHEFKAKADRNEFYNWDAPIRHKADREYISKEKAIIQLSWDLSEVELPRIKESLDKLPSVDIPPEHDGCKDCKYETYPNYDYPCCECKQNFKDMWEMKKPTDTITMTREEFSAKLMEHYRQGRADEKAYQNGEIMQSFNPD